MKDTQPKKYTRKQYGRLKKQKEDEANTGRDRTEPYTTQPEHRRLRNSARRMVAAMRRGSTDISILDILDELCVLVERQRRRIYSLEKRVKGGSYATKEDLDDDDGLY